MTPDQIAKLAGGSISGLFALVFLACAVMIVLASPFLVLSIVLNVRKIRVQFERLNELLDSKLSIR